MNRRRLALCAALLMSLPLLLGAAPILPSADYYVNDGTDLLFSDHRDFMQAFSEMLREETGTEIVVLLTPTTGDLDADTFADEVFEGWEIGGESGNGVLILYVSQTGESRILSGAALRDSLTAEMCDFIVEEHIASAAANGNPSAGIHNAYRTAAVVVYDHFGLEIPAVLTVESSDGSIWSPATLVIFAIIIFLSMRSARVTRKYQDRYTKNSRPRRQFAVDRGDDDDFAPKTPRQAEIERMKRIQLEELAEMEAEQAGQDQDHTDENKEDQPED